MRKFAQVVCALLAVCAALGAAVPRRQRARQSLALRRIPARQQLAATPYPAAEALRPAVPFVEEVAAQPAGEYGPPDQSYGPPLRVEPTGTEQLPSADVPQEFAPNPDAEECSPVEAATREQEVSSRFTNRRPARLQAQLAVPNADVPFQRLIDAVPAALPPASATVPFAGTLPVLPQQYYVVSQPFAYSSQFQAW